MVAPVVRTGQNPAYRPAHSRHPSDLRRSTFRASAVRAESAIAPSTEHPGRFTGRGGVRSGPLRQENRPRSPGGGSLSGGARPAGCGGRRRDGHHVLRPSAGRPPRQVVAWQHTPRRGRRLAGIVPRPDVRYAHLRLRIRPRPQAKVSYPIEGDPAPQPQPAPTADIAWPRCSPGARWRSSGRNVPPWPPGQTPSTRNRPHMQPSWGRFCRQGLDTGSRRACGARGCSGTVNGGARPWRGDLGGRRTTGTRPRLPGLRPACPRHSLGAAEMRLGRGMALVYRRPP